MQPIVPPEIEKYAIRNSFPQSSLFQELARETYAKTTMPQMQVGALEGAFLRLMVRMTRARRILEVGTFTGYSALAMAEALPADGELITCDIDPEFTNIAQKNWAKSPHGKKIQLKLGPALESIASLESKPFDLAFIDADKENYSNYWNAIAPRMRSGGVILVDNTLWSGEVLKPEDEETVAIDRFNRMANSDPRFECVLLTIRDGVMLGWKR